MPIKDGSLAEHYHSENRINVSERLGAKLAVERGNARRWFNRETGVFELRPGEDPNASVMDNWRDAPKLRMAYHRVAYDLANVSLGTAREMVDGLNLTRSSNVLYIGCGFGWAVEKVRVLRPGISITAVDAAGFIQSAKTTDEAGDIEAAMDDYGVTGSWRQTYMNMLLAGPRATETILDEDCLSERSRRRVRNAGGSFTHIVTNCLKWLTDVECQTLSDAHRSISVAAQVAHLVTPYNDEAAERFEPTPILNWKRMNTIEPIVKRLNDEPWYTTNSWKALLPSDTIIGIRRGEVA